MRSRQSMRLANYDYTHSGVYFITTVLTALQAYSGES